MYHAFNKHKVLKQYATRIINFCDKSNANHNLENIKIPPEPTTCCMSGCANCVWIEYAESLSKLFNDGGERAQKIILENISDPNMKAFLSTELRIMAMKAKGNVPQPHKK